MPIIINIVLTPIYKRNNRIMKYGMLLNRFTDESYVDSLILPRLLLFRVFITDGNNAINNIVKIGRVVFS